VAFTGSSLVDEVAQQRVVQRRQQSRDVQLSEL
jgi:hypothetical protein